MLGRMKHKLESTLPGEISITSDMQMTPPLWQKAKVNVKVKVTQSCPILCNWNCIVHGILQARILEWVAFPFSRGSSQPKYRTQVSHIAGGSLPAEAQGKPKNTGVGSLSLLQRIFLTQELNRSLLHCWQILHQLSYQGSPKLGCNRKTCNHFLKLKEKE